MNLVVRDPFLKDFTALTNRFNHFFDLSRESNVDYLGAWNPAVDIFDKGAEVVIHAELPGIKKEDIKIEVLDNVLTIKGERKSEDEKEGKGYHRAERHYGSFQRTIEVPGGFVEDKITATFKDGVLKVTLPKREEAKAKLIEVKAK